jgi:hypothetical protein
MATKKAGAGVFDGCVALADEGCGMTAVLVLEGKNRGQIWSIAQSGARARVAPGFFSWVELWWSRAAVAWCEARLYGALARGEVPAVARALEPMLDAALASAGDRATEEALVTLCWLRAAANRYDEALVLADRAARAFESSLTNRADPEDVAKEEVERIARGHLYRARVLKLAGRAKEAAAEVAAGLKLEGIWASTETELEAEQAALGKALERSR